MSQPATTLLVIFGNSQAYGVLDARHRHGVMREEGGRQEVVCRSFKAAGGTKHQCRIKGLGIRVWGLGFRVSGLRLRV